MLNDLIGHRIAAATLPRALSMMLLVVASIQAVQIAKTLFWPESSASAAPLERREAAPGDTPTLDLEAIQQAELFGSLAEEPARKALATQVKSRLDVKLLGIVKSSQGNASVAILAEAGRQRAYAVDDRLSVNNSARLAEILADRVVLDMSGQQQYVELEKPSSRDTKISIAATTPLQTSRSPRPGGAGTGGEADSSRRAPGRTDPGYRN
ncbi:type II secretion system protein N [Azotobacter chroococcum]|nr:type II secretion system protein N [Azotobacter chroococcum]